MNQNIRDMYTAYFKEPQTAFKQLVKEEIISRQRVLEATVDYFMFFYEATYMLTHSWLEKELEQFNLLYTLYDLMNGKSKKVKEIKKQQQELVYYWTKDPPS